MFDKKINSVTRAFLILTLVFTTSLASTQFAQAQAVGSEKAELTGTRKQLATIVFAGLAGAIFGLSTLSFHGRPQDHLSNIAIGFAVGVIGGASYTTYKAATQPYDSFDVSSASAPRSLDQHNLDSSRDGKSAATLALQPRIGWQWQF